jgi:hypothetical protein
MYCLSRFIWVVRLAIIWIFATLWAFYSSFLSFVVFDFVCYFSFHVFGHTIC